MEAYIVWLMPRLAPSAAAMSDLGQIMGEAGRNPTLIYSAAWKTLVRDATVRMRASGRELRSYNVDNASPAVRELDDKVSAIGRDTQAVADLADTGLRNGWTVALANSMVQRMDAANQHALEAQAILQRYVR